MPSTTHCRTRPALLAPFGALGAGIALLLTAAPAMARPDLTEDKVIATTGREVVHLRVQTGCGDLATDRVEMGIPESVIGVLPEAAPGWIVETEISPTEPYDLFGATRNDRVTAIRWTGGSIPIGQFREFAIAAVFRQEGTIAFPVIQGCGTEEVQYTKVPEEGQQPGEDSAVLVTVIPEPPDVDLVALQGDVEELRTTLEAFRKDIDDTRIPRLRDRIDELERRVRAVEREVGTEPSPSPG